MKKGKKAQALCQPVLLKYFSQQTEINLVFGWKGKEVEESFSHTITLFTRLFTPKAVWSLALTKHVLSNSYINRLQKRAKNMFAVVLHCRLISIGFWPQSGQTTICYKDWNREFWRKERFSVSRQSMNSYRVPTWSHVLPQVLTHRK